MHKRIDVNFSFRYFFSHLFVWNEFEVSFLIYLIQFSPGCSNLIFKFDQNSREWFHFDSFFFFHLSYISFYFKFQPFRRKNAFDIVIGHYCTFLTWKKNRIVSTIPDFLFHFEIISKRSHFHSWTFKRLVRRTGLRTHMHYL